MSSRACVNIAGVPLRDGLASCVMWILLLGRVLTCRDETLAWGHSISLASECAVCLALHELSWCVLKSMRQHRRCTFERWIGIVCDVDTIVGSCLDLSR